MVTIIFESHSTTVDNAKHISSGHADVELSELGQRQARELGERYADDKFDAIFCSDLRRSYHTAELAFANRWPIVRDARLRECDYGELTQHPSSEVDPAKAQHITEPFPGGESYTDCAKRMKAFLEELRAKYDGKRVMIIGHRATHYALDHLILNEDLGHAVTKPWAWQPGWTYQLT